jgi:hypothetical protein
MSEAGRRRIGSRAGLVGVALLGPLLVPALALALRLAARALGAAPAAAAPSLDWEMLALLGPAIPVYLVVLPLLPFGLRALGRGWRPALATLLLGLLGLGLAIDLGFALARCTAAQPPPTAIGRAGTAESRAGRPSSGTRVPRKATSAETSSGARFLA